MRILILAIPLALSSCGDPAGGSGSGSTSGPTSPPPPAPTPTPTPTTSAIVVVDSTLRSNIDVPSFALPNGAGEFTTQPNFESQFPYLAGWGVCITRRRDNSASTPARCFVRRFTLVEVNVAAGTESEIARSDFLAQRGGPIQCGFTSTIPPVRTNSACYGANFRRERNATLCWFSWCYPNTTVTDALGRPDDGIAPMSNSLIDTAGVLTIDAAAAPTLVAHWWTSIPVAPYRPASRTAQGYRYFIEIEFYTVGEAVLQLGADRWAVDGQTYRCATFGNAATANCQLFFSNWYQTTDSVFRTLRLRIAG